MPFVFDQTEVEWPEDGSDPLPPRADEFVYLPAPEYSGVSGPVRFSILPFSAPIEPAEPRLPAEPFPPVQAQPRSILDRLLGRSRQTPSPQQRQASFEERRRQAKLGQQKRTQQLFSVMIPALRAAGARRAYCRYDGGNDEGFAWLDRYELQDGNRLDLDVLANLLHEKKIHDELRAAGFTDHLRGTGNDEKIAELKSFASGWLIQYWAWLLLGKSFGTGEYSMYGAFAVDLDQCIITDDPDAGPVVENIEIAT